MKKVVFPLIFLLSCSSSTVEVSESSSETFEGDFVPTDLPSFSREPIVTCYEEKRSCFAQMTPTVSVPVYHSCFIESLSESFLEIPSSLVYDCISEKQLDLPYTKCWDNGMGNTSCFIEIVEGWWTPVSAVCNVPPVHVPLWGAYGDSSECAAFEGGDEFFLDSFCIAGDLALCFGFLSPSWGVRIVPSCSHTLLSRVEFDGC